MYIIYKAETKLELFEYGATSNYFMPSKDKHSNNDLNTQANLIPLTGCGFLAATNALFSNVTSYNSFVSTTIRFFLTITHLFVISFIPSLVERLLSTQDLEYGALCTYSQTVFEKGFKAYLVILGAYVAFFYSLTWVVKRTLTDKITNSEKSKRDSKVIEGVYSRFLFGKLMKTNFSFNRHVPRE